MDAALAGFFANEMNGASEGTTTLNVKIDFVDDAKGEIELIRDDERKPYTLKPLGELYGKGNSVPVEPQSDVFMPLFLCIEEEIAKFDATERRLTDGEVSLLLNSLGMNPEVPSGDRLAQRVQCALRMTLSLNNYSRQELRQTLRKIGKSVERHTESGRGRGYLNFIHQFFGRMRA